jgi:hypothetical protein
MLERRFRAFLYGRRVLVWVRHLARQGLASERSGARLSAEFRRAPDTGRSQAARSAAGRRMQPLIRQVPSR